MLLGWAIGCVEYGLGDPDTEAVPPVEVTETVVQAPYPGLDVLFVVDDRAHGTELWRSGGTVAGTRLVRDILPGHAGGVFPPRAGTSASMKAAGSSGSVIASCCPRMTAGMASNRG